MGLFKALPGRLDADALMGAACAISLPARELAALEGEFKAVTDAGFEPCTALAGQGLAGHVRAAQAAAAEAAARAHRAQRAASVRASTSAARAEAAVPAAKPSATR